MTRELLVYSPGERRTSLGSLSRFDPFPPMDFSRILRRTSMSADAVSCAKRHPGMLSFVETQRKTARHSRTHEVIRLKS